MMISPEEKAHLAYEVNKLTNNRPLFYLKFCSEEKFTNDVCAGKLYGNTAEYFRQKELASGERGQGDKYEAILRLHTNSITAVDSVTGNVVFTAPTGTMTVQFGVDKIIPIVSFVGIPFEDMTIIEADENHTTFTLPFSQEEYEQMEQKFGKYCVVIKGAELEDRIKQYCHYYGYDYVFDKVEYCDQNRLDRINAFGTGEKERFLYKNADLKYQREYRLVVGMEIPEDHFIRIGQLSNVGCIEANKLKDLCFTIHYSSTSSNPAE